MTRELAYGWHHGILVVGEGAAFATEAVLTKALAGDEWRVVRYDAAPDSCFKPAEPDSGAVELRSGERVWVDCPKVLAAGQPLGRAVGSGTVRAFRSGETEFAVKVRLDSLDRVAVDARCFHEAQGGLWFPAAACHREGPQSEPLHEGDVFLGRYPYGNGPLRDAWWDGTRIYFTGGHSGLRPDEIHCSPWYIAALTVARELGLPEAKKDEPAPEPERAEPKYQKVGQVVNWRDEDEDIGTARIVSKPEWGVPSEWRYTVEVLSDANGQVAPYADVMGENSNTLTPHTMTIADAPDDVLLAIWRNKPVRVMDVPVTHEGQPYSEKLGSAESDWLLRGKRVVITSVEAITNTKGHSLATLDDETTLWPWNLEVVPDA